MRFVPQIPSHADPGPWVPLAPLTLRWEVGLHPDWSTLARRGLAIHAVHLSGESPVEDGLAVLHASLGPDFLILPTIRPQTREAGFRLLGHLETLLEAASGRGAKIALSIEGGAEAAVLDLLAQAKADAVGFCWHPATVDAARLADRLWCGVCGPTSDLRPLQKLGYRWDMALPAEDPATFRAQAAALAAAHPEVIFPEEILPPGLDRAAEPPEGFAFGRHWGPTGNRS
ncbi:hypothetical protein [Geothrix sp. SG200]|uniref:hypothetical protein n=1 Tax=Geothrix sp. SG200 TaxID=2922865 RepID=UPI001FAB9976|nr:hypothetical protein [Geothrix sp. SG200]